MTDAELYEELRKRGDIVEEYIPYPQEMIILYLRNGVIMLEWSEETKKVFLK